MEGASSCILFTAKYHKENSHGLRNLDVTIFIPNGDHEVPTRIEKPEIATKERQVPAVVMLHGTGTQKDEVAGSYKRLAKMLACEGIASIRLDFLGHGESAGSEKDFNFSNARADILKASEYIQHFDWVAGDRIGLTDLGGQPVKIGMPVETVIRRELNPLYFIIDRLGCNTRIK